MKLAKRHIKFQSIHVYAAPSVLVVSGALDNHTIPT